MGEDTKIVSDHNLWLESVGRIEPGALGKSKHHRQQEKGADPSLDRIDRPPAADRQQRRPAVGAITVTTLMATTTLAILARAVASLNKSRMMAKVIAVLAAPSP